MAEESTFTVSIADEIPYQSRLVALWWDAIGVLEHHAVNLRDLLGNRVPQFPGVYAITGRHDAHSGTAVLYIGEAEDLRARVPNNIHDHLSERHADGQRTLFSDVWGLDDTLGASRL